MSDRLLSPSGTIHVRAYTRSGRHGPIEVAGHDRSAPRGGSSVGSPGPSALRGYLHPANVAKAQRKMQDYLTFFRQNAARDKEKGVDNGRQLAVTNLEHFLDGTGTPVVLSSEQVARMPALINAEETARKRFEKTFLGNTDDPDLNGRLTGLPDGQSAQIADFWDTQTNPLHGRPGDYASIGRSSVHSDGRFRATRKGDLITIEGEITHRLGAKDPNQARPDYYRDPFDFDPGQPGSFPAITLEHASKAKRFDMVSEPRRQSVTAQVRVQPDGRLVLDGAPIWGPIR